MSDRFMLSLVAFIGPILGSTITAESLPVETTVWMPVLIVSGLIGVFVYSIVPHIEVTDDD